MKYLTLFLLYFSLNTFAQKNEIFHIDSLPTEGVLLNKNWKWHAGDNPDFAKADFDDLAWESIDPTLEVPKLQQINTDKPLWLRLNLSNKNDNTFLASIVQSGATEIFLNGKLIAAYGQIENASKSTVAYDPLNDAFILHLDSNNNTLAVRYYFQKNINYNSIYNINFPLFSIHINDRNYPTNIYLYFWDGFNVAVPFLLFIVHFIFFLIYTPNKTNFWYSLASFFGFIGSFLLFKMNLTHNVESKNYFSTYASIPLLFNNILIYYTIYLFLKQRKIWMVISFAGLSILALSLNYFDYFQSSVFFNYLLSLMYMTTVMYMGNRAWKQGQIGGLYLVFGMIAYIISWTLFILSFQLGWGSMSSDILFHIAILIIPIIVSVLLGLEFKNINNSLIQNLQEVNKLSTEKQHILATQNETLEKQVQERTAELVHKNRDLEIEGALEKVRARSLEMQRSDELKEVVATLYEQLRHLGFQYGAACIFIIDKETNDLIQWVSGFNQSEYPIGYYIKYFNHPVWEAQFTAWKNGDKYVELLLAGEEKKVFDEYMFTQTDFKNFPEQGKAFMQSLPSVVFSLAFLKHGALQWGPEKLNDEQAKILQKFAVVFEQAYTRFLDLQKAEEQTREAQIETALEKIRGRSLAMHRSAELKEVMVIMFEKMKESGVIRDGGIGIHLFTEGVKDNVLWVANPSYINEPSCIKLPYDENILAVGSYFTEMFKAKEEGRDVFNKIHPFEEKNRYFDYVFANNDFETIPPPVRDFIRTSKSQTFSMAIEKNSSVVVDSWTEQLMTEKEFDVLKRLARVFEQAYIRFLDLKKAEAQAREAEIELSLERVRARTMAMQHSEELGETAKLLFQQVQALGIPAWSCGYNIWEKEEKVCIGWMSSNGILQPPFKIPLTESPSFIRQYESKQKGEDFYIEEVSGEALAAHYQYMDSLPDFGEILKDFLKSGFTLPNFQINHIVNFKQGNMVFITGEPVPEAWDIFKRFAKVFEQTYTRFLDLKNAEALAEQAHLDLIQIQTEKKKAEDALTLLKSTQAQLIQSEKLASLGELTAGIAHEIQNPLNFVNNFSELSVELIDELKSPLTPKGGTLEAELLSDISQNLEKINHHGKRASNIVKGMLEHSRASTGVKELTDINKLADEYLRLSYHGLRAKDKDFNADFKTDFDENLPKIEVIPQDIGRVLLNLINNAFYAVAPQPPKGEPEFSALSRLNDESYVPTVTVSTDYSAPPLGAGGAQIIIKVKDNGIGMSEATKAKAFQPFFTTKPTGQGTGLGLSLAYDIVTKGHGGSLEVESTEGVGSEFIITLPFKTN